MAVKLPSQNAPLAESREQARANIFYPRASVTLSVIFESFGDPKKPIIIPVTPKKVTVFSNSYKEADTWSIDFDSKDLPVSPELIRGGSVEIYLYQTRGISTPDIIRAADVEADPFSLEGLEPTIVGLFDEASLEFDDKGKITSIDGTDYTALFLAKQWRHKKENISGLPTREPSGNKKGRIPGGKALDATLRDLMAEVESAGAMSLKVEGIDKDGNPPKMPKVGSAEGRTNSRGIPVKQGFNYWDAMYNLAIRYGFILFVRNLDVVLSTPQAYVAGQSKIRKMAWGKNLTSLKMTRRIGKVVTPVVEVRSYDEKTRKIIKAKYPKNRKQHPVTGLGTKRNEMRVYTFPGIGSEEQLGRIAETIYNLIARSEQTVEMATMDLRDLEGRDMIELRTGQAVSIGFDAFNSRSDILEGQSDGQRVQTLMSLGYTAEVAQTISKTFDTINVFKRPFRVKEATLEWGEAGGLSISAELQNFINIADQGDGDTKE